MDESIVWRKQNLVFFRHFNQSISLLKNRTLYFQTLQSENFVSKFCNAKNYIPPLLNTQTVESGL
jgi:hypothetical protein